MAGKKQSELRNGLSEKRGNGTVFILLLPLIFTLMGVIFASLILIDNSLGKYAVPSLITASLGAVFLLVYARVTSHSWQRTLIIIMFLGIGSAFLINLMPTIFFGFHILGVFHRSTVSAILLMLVSLPTFSFSIFYIFGATPKAQDLSRYPFILLPIIVALAAFGLIIYKLLVLGVPHFSWRVITSNFIWHGWSTQVWVNGWPVTISYNVQQIGIGQYIMGTFLLMMMVSLISLPIGVGVGLYITEYSKGATANIIKFATNSLRAISVFAIGLVALSVVRSSANTFLAPILSGFYYNENGVRNAASGSFITASIFISMLVIPIIASATEEGIHSLPHDLTEASLGIGASHNYTIAHIVLPWALPNIVTGLLLGCAETAGSLAAIMLISGTSQYGINPFTQSTSLSVFIYQCLVTTDQSFKKVEGPYVYMAALILILITLGLTIASLILKKRFSRSYRGT